MQNIFTEKNLENFFWKYFFSYFHEGGGRRIIRQIRVCLQFSLLSNRECQMGHWFMFICIKVFLFFLDGEEHTGGEDSQGVVGVENEGTYQ